MANLSRGRDAKFRICTASECMMAELPQPTDLPHTIFLGVGHSYVND